MSKASDKNSSDALRLLASRAIEFGARIEHPFGSDLRVTITIQRADGKQSEYRLAISRDEDALNIRERAPRRLPIDCPERHLNDDGTFCMNWDQAEPIFIVDEVSTDAFWARLTQFLLQQERAVKKRRWPSRRVWAHGAAAEHQQRAEECAAVLGPKFSKALQRGALTVMKSRGSGGQFLRLLMDGKRVYSVWKKEQRIATRRQRCICGNTRLPICDCADHEHRAVDLVFAIVAWREEEEQFWAANKARPCCGTIDGCPRALGEDDIKIELKSAA